MFGFATSHLPGLLALAFTSCFCATAFAQVQADAEKVKKIEEGIERKPLIIMLARGAEGTCGVRCKEWIGIEGNFDKKSAQKVKEFITRLNRFDLPVFLNSEGGYLSQAIAVGLFFRDHRMTVAVGQTVPTNCNLTNSIQSECREIMMKEGKHPSHLIFGDNARCASACIYALTGGATRHVNAQASLLVHAGVQLRSEGNRDAAIARLKLFVVSMGINPALVDIGLAVPFENFHALSRQEIAKLGIETRGRYETPWVSLSDIRLGAGNKMINRVIAKAVTLPAEGHVDRYESRNISFTCNQHKRSIQLQYRMRLTWNYSGPPAKVHIQYRKGLTSKSYHLDLLQFAANDAVRGLFLSSDMAREIADASGLHFRELRNSASLTAIDINTDRLSDKMADLNFKCGEKSSPFRYPPRL